MNKIKIKLYGSLAIKLFVLLTRKEQIRNATQWYYFTILLLNLYYFLILNEFNRFIKKRQNIIFNNSLYITNHISISWPQRSDCTVQRLWWCINLSVPRKGFALTSQPQIAHYWYYSVFAKYVGAIFYNAVLLRMEY